MRRSKRISPGGVMLVLFTILGLGMPLWAGEKDVHKGIGGRPKR